MAFKTNTDRRIAAATAQMDEMGAKCVRKDPCVAAFWASKPYEGTYYTGLPAHVKSMAHIAPTRYREYEVYFGVNPKYTTSAPSYWVAEHEEVIKTLQAWAHASNVKATAAARGLTYWPAIAGGQHKVDITAYKTAERILTSQGKGIYGTKNQDGTKCFGGWDSQGHYGLSPWKVRKYWYLAGCKDTSKFKKLVANHNALEYTQRRYLPKLITKGTPTSHITPIIRGVTWWTHHAEKIGVEVSSRVSPKVFRAIGMLSPPLRWAAVFNLHLNWGSAVERGSSDTLRIRDLNWEAVKAVQDKKVPRNHFVDKDITAWGVWWKCFHGKSLVAEDVKRIWELLGKPNPRLLGINPQQVIALAYRSARYELEPVTENSFIPAWNLCRLFGKNTNAMETFIAFARNVHDAGQLQLPSGKISPIWGGWIAAKPTLAAKTRLINLAEEWLGGVPATLQQATDSLNAVSPPPGTDMLDSMDEHTRRAYVQLVPMAKTWEAVPAPILDPAGPYTLSQLAVGDIRAAMAGLLTDCCQHLHGAASSCAALSYTHPQVAVWAVFKGDVVVAQSLVWKSADQKTLVMDSVEALGGYRNNTTVAHMFIAAAETVVGKLGIKRVLLSKTSYGMTSAVGNVLSDYSDLKSVDTPDPAVKLGYSDAGSKCYVVCQAEEGSVCEKKTEGLPPVAIQAHDTDQVCVDELMEDSDVCCEYCDAEVHPLCCVCPSCGADISEFVD